jgi:GNAT superfamily N-acetyltransferase
MRFQSLNNISILEIADAFTAAFHDYFISISFNEATLKTKIDLEDIYLNYSVGAFHNNKLVGFILHGFRKLDGENCFYNAGTGVLPEYRGNNLTYKMYNYFFEQINDKDKYKISLEVIFENNNAIKSYEKVGFKKSDILNCYKINNQLNLNRNQFNFSEVPISEVEAIVKAENYCFEWQNDILNKAVTFQNIKIIAAKSEQKTIGFVLFNTVNMRVIQIIAVKNFRRQKVASSLLSYLYRTYDEKISIINVSDYNASVNAFLINVGFKVYLKQFKMTYNKSFVPSLETPTCLR